MTLPELSFVVPVLNEAPSLRALYDALVKVLGGRAFELFFVDDGSRDGSWDEISRLAAEDSRVHGLRLRRNFGKAAALAAGFSRCRAPVCFTLDADLQDDPAEIPRFLSKLSEGFDVVSGWKKVRHDPMHKVLFSRLFNAIVSFLSGVKLHDHNCGFKAYRREALGDLHLYGELHRFIPVLLGAKGFQITEIAVSHNPRRHGQSKYGSSRLFKGFFDILSVMFVAGFAQRPLHFMGAYGLIAMLGGAGGLTYLAIVWLMGEGPIGTRPLLFYSIAGLILGFQIISMGLVAELITAYHLRQTDTYQIWQTTKNQERLQTA
jgi:glycosyltransferase involved in cell wall biosynthesis